MTDSFDRMKAQKDAMTEAEAARKLANLSKALLDDANAECRLLIETLGDLVEVADGTLAMLDAKRKAGDFDHWESFEMSDFALAIQKARTVLFEATSCEAVGTDNDRDAGGK